MAYIETYVYLELPHDSGIQREVEFQVGFEGDLSQDGHSPAGHVVQYCDTFGELFVQGRWEKPSTDEFRDMLTEAVLKLDELPEMLISAANAAEIALNPDREDSWA